MPEIIFQFATSSDGSRVLALLQRAGLPTGDLIGQTWNHFILATRGGVDVGAIGLEAGPPFGLVRSLAVEKIARGSGLGAQLLGRIETHALSLGITELGLITESAAPYFLRQGYHVIARPDAPDALRETKQFRDICPASAAIMLKSVS